VQLDIVKQKPTFKFKRNAKLAAIAAVLLLFSAYQFSQPNSDQKVERSELLIGTVQHGDIQVTVDGYGRLRSDKQKLLTSLTNATVEEIVLKPGSVVEPSSTVLILSNPELLVELDQAKQRLSQQNANLRQLELNNKRDLMAEDAEFATLKADYQSVRMRREAEEGLAKAGIISMVTFKVSVAQERQLSERIEIQKQRRAQLLLVQAEAILIQQQQIKQEEAYLLTIQHRVDRLVVKANMKGVLQSLPVELGQSVVAGQALALIGSTDDLAALIQVPQTQVNKIQIGQSAIVDTRIDKIPGKVTRIDPAVVNGSVTVEIAFSGPLPSSALPELNVDAAIFSKKLHDVYYIQRPVKIAENSSAALFKLSPDRTAAHSVPLKFGSEAGKYIQIQSGVKEGDSFILSDLSRFDQQQHITITQ
jgi:multidrug efflux pump subunit AcrA (membrane-fusion protein)